MMQFEIRKEFDKWYREQEGFATRAERACSELSTEYKVVESWLYAAFSMGAKAAYEDCNSALLEFGTHLAGIEAPKGYTYTQGYDHAAENLQHAFRDAIVEWNKF